MRIRPDVTYADYSEDFNEDIGDNDDWESKAVDTGAASGVTAVQDEESKEDDNIEDEEDSDLDGQSVLKLVERDTEFIFTTLHSYRQ